MTDFHSLNAPLLVANANGQRKVMAHWFQHPQGVLFFEPFWNEFDDIRGIHLLKGAVIGSDPWKIGEYVITRLGCINTHREQRLEYEQWMAKRGMHGYNYPRLSEIRALAMEHGASDAQ